MKTIRHTLLLLLLVASGCNLLEIEPTSQIDAGDALKDKKGIESALAGAYDILQSAAISQDVFVFADLAADNLIHVGTKKEYRQISDQRIFAENAYVEDIWNVSYTGINRVNNILVALDDAEGLSDAEKNSVRAQCHFLRAFHYFNLVKYFGGVPLKQIPTTGAAPEDLNIPRSSVSDIYDFLINDLETARDLLDGTGKKSSLVADEGAVRGLLARAYLYRGNFPEALAEAGEVISMGYSLVDGSNYASIFNESVTNNEIIFQIDFVNDQEVSGMADWFLPDSRFEVAAWDQPSKESSIADAFPSGDVRKDAVIGTTDLYGSLDYYGKKYTDFNTDKDNTPVIRLAEIYLIAAEASNEIAFVSGGSAFDYLNEVRTRAGLTAYQGPDLPDQASFRLAVEEERRLELCFEGHRYFDLVRTGRAGEVIPQLGPLLTENEFLFPIPRSEMDTNEAIIDNNPGY